MTYSAALSSWAALARNASRSSAHALQRALSPKAKLTQTLTHQYTQQIRTEQRSTIAHSVAFSASANLASSASRSAICWPCKPRICQHVLVTNIPRCCQWVFMSNAWWPLMSNSCCAICSGLGSYLFQTVRPFGFQLCL